jgi:uncharacterized protein (DUF1800 family)
MHRIRISRLAAVLFSLAGAACGGGGGGGTPSGDPPTSLTYATTSATFETAMPIAPNVATTTGGDPDLFVVSPALPAGLSIDPSDGTITGTPTAPTPQGQYVVSASNEDGAAQAVLTITVMQGAAEDLAAQATFSDDDIRFFLGRTRFGATEAEFDAVKAAGIPATVDAMVEFGDTTALEQQAFGLLVNDSDPVGLEGGFPSHAQVARYWVHLMLNNPNAFQEVLAFFWHDHFACSTTVVEGGATHFMVDTIELLRTRGNGNLRTLLLDVSRDPMMLTFLDGVLNTKGSPNENYARELWELFSLGHDNGYTQADIVQSARALTGYRMRFAPSGQQYVEFDPNRHDTGSKTFFGQTIVGQNATDDYQRVIDITVDNRPVAEFVCRKLFEHFCHPDASDVAVNELAAQLRTGGYELKPVLRTLFKSRAFFSAKSKAGIVKGPVEHLIGFCRSTGLTPIDPKAADEPAAAPPNMLRTLDSVLTQTAQRPSMPPSVNGWPVSEEWLSAQNMLDRANGVRSCITDRTDQANANGGADLAAALLPPAATSATTVDALAARLHVTLTPAERTQLITYLDTSYNATTQVVTPSPFDPANATHVAERVRGLLYILAQHPTYAIR